MNVHVLQHVAFEDIGSMQTWMDTHAKRVEYTRFYEDPRLPDLEDIHLIVVMGGPMSANDETQFPWLGPEKRFLARAIHEGKSVVGVCLGAQLVANALGAAVYRGDQKEIGWLPVQTIKCPSGSYLLPNEPMVFQWHGETFDLPPGALHLARSSAFENQAFQIADRILGLQFHLEVTRKGIDDLVSACREELVEGTWNGTGEQILYGLPENYRVAHKLMDEALSFVTRPWT